MSRRPSMNVESDVCLHRPLGRHTRAGTHQGPDGQEDARDGTPRALGRAERYPGSFLPRAPPHKRETPPSSGGVSFAVPPMPRERGRIVVRRSCAGTMDAVCTAVSLALERSLVG